MESNPVNSNLRHRFHGIQRAPPVPLVNVRDRQQINQNRKGRKPMYSNSRETAIELAKVPEAKKNEFKRDTIRDVVAIVKLAKKPEKNVRQPPRRNGTRPKTNCALPGVTRRGESAIYVKSWSNAAIGWKPCSSISSPPAIQHRDAWTARMVEIRMSSLKS